VRTNRYTAVGIPTTLMTSSNEMPNCGAVAPPNRVMTSNTALRITPRLILAAFGAASQL